LDEGGGIYLKLGFCNSTINSKAKIKKMIMILDDASSHVVSSAKVGKCCGFSTLELSNMTLEFLAPNVISVVQQLDQSIKASFKIQYKKKLCNGFYHSMMILQ
jgi:hypothetical protein